MLHQWMGEPIARHSSSSTPYYEFRTGHGGLGTTPHNASLLLLPNSQVLVCSTLDIFGLSKEKYVAMVPVIGKLWLQLSEEIIPCKVVVWVLKSLLPVIVVAVPGTAGANPCTIVSVSTKST